MKTVKIVLLSGLISLASVSFAQKQHQTKKNATPEMRAERMTKMMTTKLSLTDDQAKKIEVVNLDMAKKQEALSAQRKELQNERKTKYEAILTPEQLKKLKDSKKARRANWKKNRTLKKSE